MDKNYCIQIQFGLTDDYPKTRTMNVFITSNVDNKPLTLSKLKEEFCNKIKSINSHFNYYKYNNRNNIIPIIAWDDLEYYTKYFIYKHNFKYDSISLRYKGYISYDNVLDLANEFIFLNDDNREEKINELCYFLLTKKDLEYNYPWEGERSTNLEYCIKYCTDKNFFEKYNHLIQAKKFDLI